MEIKCPNCVASLVFDATSGKMQCKFCGSYFTMADVKDQFEAAGQASQSDIKEPTQAVAPDYNATGTGAADSMQTSAQPAYAESDTMQCNIYSCTSCGAELAVNGVETSTFCAYCGQPSIVFSRVSQTLKPELIIPFSIQKQQAINIIRNRFNQGKFIPQEVKNFEIERVRGIYIPYWLYDAYYYDKQLIKGRVGSGKNSTTKYFMREADCEFHKVSLDASSNLNDESSQRLEPFDMRGLREFEVGYMSGFYSDRYDRNNKDLRRLASYRIKELFDSQTMASCSARNKSVVASSPKMTIRKETYAMLPAWFMTFRYQDKPYTMLVNGQTGKIVGAVPYDNAKVKGTAIATFFLSLLFSVPVGIALMFAAFADDEGFKVLLIIGFVLFSMVSAGLSNLTKLRNSEKLTASQQMNKFAHERQDGGGDFV